MRKKGFNCFLLVFLKITGILPALLFFKTKVYYEDKSVQSLNLKRPCILMSNHTSLLDFVLYEFLFYFNSIRFLMAEVLFKKSKFFSWFLKGLGGIYVNRDQVNYDFIGQSLETLDNNGIVGIFPQGRLPVNGKPFPFKPGIVYVALRTNAPIIPVCTDGNYGLFKRAHVIIGKPINIHDFCKNTAPEDADAYALTEILQKENDRLLAMLKGKIEK